MSAYRPGPARRLRRRQLLLRWIGECACGVPGSRGVGARNDGSWSVRTVEGPRKCGVHPRPDLSSQPRVRVDLTSRTDRRPGRAQMHGVVIATEWLTPSLVRLILSGGDLDGFAMPEHTDAYVNVALPPPDAPYGEVFDPAEVKRDLPRSCGRGVAATPCAAGTPSSSCSPSTSWSTARRGPPARGQRRPGPARCWSSRVPAAATAPTRPPTGTCWSATSRRCRRSRPRWRPCRSTHWPSCGCSATAPSTRSPLSSAGELDVVWLHRTGDVRDVSLLRRRGARGPVPPRPGARVRARRGGGGPRDPPPPPRRARADPAGHVLLAVLAPDDDRRGLARGQARLRHRHGGRRRLTAD